MGVSSSLPTISKFLEIPLTIAVARYAVGWTLDLAGGMSPLAWGLAFLVIAVLMAAALASFLAIRPRELEGDRRG